MRRFYQAAMGGKAVSSTVFIINEDCEGTGTPTPWTTVTGVPNWDYSTVALAGSQSVYMALNGAACRARTSDQTVITDAWLYFLVRFTNGTNPSAVTTFAGFSASGVAAITDTLQLTTTRQLRAGAATGSVATMSLDTTYHVWYHYVQGTGADSLEEAYFSSDGVRPASGSNNWSGSTTQGGTNSVARYHIGSSSVNFGMDAIFDNIRAASTSIGDNGT